MESIIIGTLVTSLLGVTGKLIWNWKLSVDRKQAELEASQKSIVSNYISRFDEVKEKINETEKNILEKISEVNVQVASMAPKRRVRS